MNAKATFFIYYKVPADRLADVHALLQVEQARLAVDLPGVSIRFWRRQDPSDQAQMTLMETIEASGNDGLASRLVLAEQRLAAALEAFFRHAGLPPVQRHVERFEPLLPLIKPGRPSPCA